MKLTMSVVSFPLTAAIIKKSLPFSERSIKNPFSFRELSCHLRRTLKLDNCLAVKSVGADGSPILTMLESSESTVTVGNPGVTVSPTVFDANTL